ncbi:MAG: hypothetical protein P9M08_11435 [Candidatus Erginobacter occultus]|nr:hypothetical protein [Candidatus Erginobacter occultus]
MDAAAASSPQEIVTQGLSILARIIAREAINDHLAACVPERPPESDYQLMRPAERAAGM